MATGTFKFFGAAAGHMARSNLDFSGNTFKVMLTTSAYTPDQDAHDYRDDVTNEVSGAGYTAGGAAATVSLGAYDASGNLTPIVVTDVTWAAATITARTAVLYKSRGGASSADELVGYITFSGDVSVSTGTLTLDLPATGIATLAPAA